MKSYIKLIREFPDLMTNGTVEDIMSSLQKESVDELVWLLFMVSDEHDTANWKLIETILKRIEPYIQKKEHYDKVMKFLFDFGNLDPDLKDVIDFSNTAYGRHEYGLSVANDQAKRLAQCKADYDKAREVYTTLLHAHKLLDAADQAVGYVAKAIRDRQWRGYDYHRSTASKLMAFVDMANMLVDVAGIIRNDYDLAGVIEKMKAERFSHE